MSHLFPGIFLTTPFSPDNKKKFRRIHEHLFGSVPNDAEFIAQMSADEDPVFRALELPTLRVGGGGSLMEHFQKLGEEQIRP
jgi:hypothetical protein